MLMIRAIIRPEKKDEMLAELSRGRLPCPPPPSTWSAAANKKGIRIGGVVYDEIPKVLVMMAIRDEDKDDIVRLILQYAKSGDKGAYGDGKIFVSPILEAYTVSSGAKGL